METFRKTKKDWLHTFFRLPEAILFNFNDTFNRVFSTLAHNELESSFSMRDTREHGFKSIVHMAYRSVRTTSAELVGSRIQ